MLLTNQKNINYKNLYEIQKETTPSFFTAAKIIKDYSVSYQKTKFNKTFAYDYINRCFFFTLYKKK